MKKISLIIAVITACGAFAVTDLQAQQANRQQRRGPQMVMPSAMSSEQRVKMLADSLKLTEEQQTKLKAVFDEQAAAMRELNGKDRSERQEAMQKIRNEQDAKLKEILTEDQYKTYTTNMARGFRGGQGGPGQGGPQAMTLDQRVDRIARALDLNDDMKAKLKACLDENEKAMTELRRNNQSMSQSERREAMQKLRTEQENKLKEILGEDLYKKYQEQARNFGPGNFPQRMTPAQQAEDIAKRLDLTADQKKKMEEFYTEQQKNMQEMFTKMQGLTNDERREAMQKSRTESEAKLKEILGEDLYKKYQEEMRSRGPAMMGGRQGGPNRGGNPGNRPPRRGGGNQ